MLNDQPTRDDTPTYLFNPLTEDFTTTYASDDNIPIEYTAKALSISEFPAYIAHKIAKNLASHAVLSRGVKTNYQDEYEAMLSRIIVKLWT